jgi:hypothetical protein
VLGSIVTVIGSLIALYLKEVLAVRSLERWKAHQTLLGVYRRYQLPIFHAAEELSVRAYGLARGNNDTGSLELLDREISREPHALVSDHYLQYRFVSNVYRLCSFLGWVELYRRDIGTLDVDSIDRNHLLEACLSNIQGPLADGWINQHEDIKSWRDCLVFREELRAIGNRMIAPGKELGVIDFGTFYEALRADFKGTGEARWFHQAALFFDGLGTEKDFRRVRFRMLVIFLTDLMEVLQPGRLKRPYIWTALDWLEVLDEVTGGPNWASRVMDVEGLRSRLFRGVSRTRGWFTVTTTTFGKEEAPTTPAAAADFWPTDISGGPHRGERLSEHHS